VLAERADKHIIVLTADDKERDYNNDYARIKERRIISLLIRPRPRRRLNDLKQLGRNGKRAIFYMVLWLV